MKAKQPAGEGHKARIAVEAFGSIEVGGEKQDFRFNYDVTVTMENIEYAVKQIAGGISKAADRVAKNGLSELTKAA